MPENQPLVRLAEQLPSFEEQVSRILQNRRLSMGSAAGINIAAKAIAPLCKNDINLATATVLEWKKSLTQKRQQNRKRWEPEHSQENVGGAIHTGGDIRYEDE